MMENVITVPTAHVARLLNKRSLAYNKAVAGITYRALAKGYSIPNIIWLAQQIALETNWGNSNSLDVDRNAWGMNCVSTRETTQIGCRETDSGEVLGQYTTVGDSSADRLLWDSYFGYDSYKRSNDYPEQVSSKYHTSPNYADTVSAVDSRSARIAVWISLLMVPTEAYILWKILKILF